MSLLYGCGLQVEVNKINTQMRMNLAKKGLASRKNLVRVFVEMDTNGNHFLDPEEFQQGLAMMGLFPTKI